MAIITLVNDGTTYNIHHADHGITIQQMDYICHMFPLVTGNNIVIEQVDLPVEHGTVPCGLVGPEMGDEPVKDEDVIYYPRGNRDYVDRMHLTAQPRQIDFVQCIGATRWVPSLESDGDSNRFWAEHALCG